jgi:membrane-associated phospholipid phosphatase
VTAFAALVMALSWRQVRRGRWAHVDASAPRERRDLNRALLAVTMLAAVLAQVVAHDPRVALALGLAAGILVFALLTARRWKLSLHVAFAAFAALLLWTLHPLATAAMLAFTAAIAWSRLRLARHAPRDLVAGAFAGVCAGVVHGALSGPLRP